jgi:tripartite-type tricarboxylate transporter receptor subunit TctC
MMSIASRAAGALGGSRVRSVLTAIGLASAVLVATVVGSQPAGAAWPEKPITMVVCFPAGGGTDTAARMINIQLGEALGQPVIIENRAGASGNIGIASVARAAADGYTLLVCSSAFVVNPSLFAKSPYDPFKDFEPIMVLGAAPNVFVVPKQSPIQSMKEFIDKAKAEPGKMNWTTPGMGTTPYSAGEFLKQATGIQMVHVPFTGAGPATQAAIAGQVDLYSANLGSLMGQIESGLLRPLAVTAETRWPALPNVPTMVELGIKDAVSDTFQAVYAPKGTPKPIIDRLVKEIGAILARPDVKEKFAKSGLPVTAEPPDAMRARIAREVPMFKAILEKAGIKKR